MPVQRRMIPLQSCIRMKRGFCSARTSHQFFFRASLLTLGCLMTVQLARAESKPVTRVATQSPTAVAVTQTGVASFYGGKHHGRLTANGETFDMYALTAAHRKLPFGTKLKVTSLANNRSVIVRINDRGPFVNGRVIDLSYGAAAELQMLKSGLADVKLEIVN